MCRKLIGAAIVGLFSLGLAGGSALADPSYFAIRCALCHYDDNPTCSGCHEHVQGGFVARTDKNQYWPGEPVRVTLSSWNWPGWVRAILYDHNGLELTRVSGPTGTGDDGSGNPALELPVVLVAPAPLAAGSYRWTVAWFGSGGSPGNEFPHLEEPVQTNSFDVSGSPPSTTTTTTTSSTTTTVPSTTTTTTTASTTTTTATTTSTTASTTTTSTSSTTSTTLPGRLDDFLCYKVRARQDVSVNLSDQFDSGQYVGRAAKLLCAPADSGAGISDPQTHLMSYRIKGPHLRRTAIEVANRFGTYYFDTKKTYGLMVPTAKSVIPDPPPGPPDPASAVDHYRCLTIKRTRGTPEFPKGVTIAVTDQFGTHNFVIKKPRTLCVPTDKNGEGVERPQAYLTCYRGKVDPRVSVAGVQVNNQLGQAVLNLTKETELCVASQPPPGPTTTTTTTSSTTSTTGTTSTSTTTTTLPANEPPTIVINADRTEGPIALSVQFTASASDPDGEIVAIDWDFDDGTVGSGVSASHVFRVAGGYKVAATATDNRGDKARATILIVATPLAGGSVDQQYPTRLALGPQGKLYVSDASAGSVLVYDSDLNFVGEISGIDLPLGVAVDSQGRIYVGSDGADSVEVYDGTGIKLYSIDPGGISMPNDIAIDTADILYVVDSRANTVRVYSAAGTWLRDIGGPGEGAGKLRFPAAVTIGGEPPELYVADQGHSLVQVFDPSGTFLRNFGGAVGAFSPQWKGLFVRMQSLSLDGRAALQVADTYMDRVQFLDRTTGEFLGYYGEFGGGAGQLNLPLDLVITADNRAIVADAENHRIQWFDLEVP